MRVAEPVRVHPLLDSGLRGQARKQHPHVGGLERPAAERAEEWNPAADPTSAATLPRTGTSLAMIDQTYGHLVLDADEQERHLLDTFDVALEAAEALVSASLLRKGG